MAIKKGIGLKDKIEITRHMQTDRDWETTLL